MALPLMLVGAATPAAGGSDYSGLDTSAGPFSCRRSYNGQTDFAATFGVPTSFAASNAHIDYDTAERYVSVYSFKPDVIKLAAGDLDDAINAFLASIPSGHQMIVSIWHEADGKLRTNPPPFTLAQFKAAFIRFATLVHQANNSNLYVALILEAYQPTTAGTLYADLWPGRGFADILLFDGYNDLGTGPSVWDKGRLFAEAHDVPWGIAECGIRNGAVSPQWMAEQAGYALLYGAVCFCWFNTTTGGVQATPGTDPTALTTAKAISVACRAGV